MCDYVHLGAPSGGQRKAIEIPKNIQEQRYPKHRQLGTQGKKSAIINAGRKQSLPSHISDRERLIPEFESGLSRVCCNTENW